MSAHRSSKQAKPEGATSLGNRRSAIISEAFTLVLPRASPKLVLPPTPTTPESDANDKDYASLTWRPRTPSSPSIGHVKDAYLPPTPPPEDCHLTLSPTRTLCEEIPNDAPSTQSTLPGPTKDNSFSGILKAGHQLHEHLLTAYSIVDDLGSGGFGVVVRGIRREDSRQVAIKLMWKSRVPKENWLAVQGWNPASPSITYSVSREAFILRKIDYQGVVAFIDYFEDDIFAYLIMEYFGSPWNIHDLPAPSTAPSMNPVLKAAKQIGRISKASNLIRNKSSPTLELPPTRPAPMRRTSCDLFECLEQYDHMPEETSKYIFKQIVDSVAYLHSRGIVHCDLKDENIVIDADFRVKLIDFGSAVMLDPTRPAPFHESFRGTINFAAPEILEGQLFQAPSAEIWALGCILSILITGRGPFPDAASAVKGQISVPSVPMSRNAFDLMMGCLQVRPRSRLTIMQIQDHPWFKEGC